MCAEFLCSEINAATVYAALKRRPLCLARRELYILRAPKHAEGENAKTMQSSSRGRGFSEMFPGYFQRIFTSFLKINEKVCFDDV